MSPELLPACAILTLAKPSRGWRSAESFRRFQVCHLPTRPQQLERASRPWLITFPGSRSASNFLQSPKIPQVWRGADLPEGFRFMGLKSFLGIKNVTPAVPAQVTI